MEDKIEIFKDIEDYFNFDSKKQIDFLKHLSKVLCYNQSYQVNLFDKKTEFIRKNKFFREYTYRT